MRSLKVLAVIGLAVALASWLVMPALATRVAIEISGTATAGDLFVQVDTRDPVKVTLTAGQAIKAVRDVILNALNTQKAGTAEAIGDNQILIIADTAIKLGEASATLTSLPFEPGKDVKARGLTFKVVAMPTLTEWGLIVLGLMLAGSMGFMIRRRITARPAGA